MCTEIGGVCFDIHKHVPKLDFLKSQRNENTLFFNCLQYPKKLFGGKGQVLKLPRFSFWSEQSVQETESGAMVE
jgi:hypothetical protein